MPRSPRIHAPGAMYHVTLRGNHRQDIFFTPADRSLLTHIIRDILVDCGAQLHAYCYMTNHVHALLQVSDTPLSKIMLLMAGRYARRVQARLETTGHLFEKRYHALLVDADEYLLALLRYIHLNPVRASLVSSPDEYPWSSHHAYLGRRYEPWLTTQFALRMLGTDRQRATAAYESLIRSASTGSPLDHRNEHVAAEGPQRHHDGIEQAQGEFLREGLIGRRQPEPFSTRCTPSLHRPTHILSRALLDIVVDNLSKA